MRLLRILKNQSITAMGALLCLAPSAEATTKITYGIWDEIQAPFIQKQIDQFEKENPDIKVQLSVVPWNVYWQKMEASAKGGAMADLAWMNMESVGKFALNGALEPLDTYLAKNGFSWKDYPAFTAESYRVNGQYFGLPRDIDSMGFAFNKEIFRKAGVALPTDKWTWADMLAAAKKIKEKDPGVHAVGMDLSGQNSWYNFIYQNGGSVLNPERTKSRFNSPAGIKAVSEIYDLIESGLMAEKSAMSDFDALTLFYSGKVAMYFMGSWEVVGLSAHRDMKGHVGIARMPINGPRRATLSHTLAHVIAANSSHKAEAWKLLAFLSSDAALDSMASGGLIIPAKTGYLQKWKNSKTFKDGELDVSAFAKAFDDAVALPTTLNTMAWKTKEEEILKRVWLGKLSAEAAAQEIETATNKALEKETKLRKGVGN